MYKYKKHSDRIKIDKANQDLYEYENEDVLWEEFNEWKEWRRCVEEWNSDEYEYYYAEWLAKDKEI